MPVGVAGCPCFTGHFRGCRKRLYDRINKPEACYAAILVILGNMEVLLNLPDELSAVLAASGQDLCRAAFEAIALEAYRENKLSTAQLRRVLGYHTRAQVPSIFLVRNRSDYNQSLNEKARRKPGQFR